ncbi:DUF4136 domain-containing protein [Flammeovirga kamogawensis]|uniref:DUF4136 domain-containing protein n=1 Tax=Flammeovirga kamogawensis TaxID=373891 RepID=A0ABX8GRX6_9BACT|nr:DUF4136 domain-containing protein [Flammeovirga kamogawensis]MBB6462752.1 hypothetical protein [Flammeovirga kamogawensis]QWG06017.1 DUF4136 domain-containing protein [Flammeovirga kamogawensis]TRX67848.1 DUF4136 domain-containing protein [Flammeovirga kamogawensis]
MKKINYIVLALASLFSITSCNTNDEYPDQVSDYDTVITNKNSDYNDSFSTAKTFSVPNYVVHIGEDSSEGYQLTSTDEIIINETILEMKAAGYTFIQENETDKPDLVVLPYSFDNTVVGSVTAWPTYGDWGDYWGGYWGGYWGWNDMYPMGGYYPFYGYPMTSYYSYDQGTVILEMVDNRKAVMEDGENQVPVIWQGILNGTETNLVDNQNRIKSGIDQMFIQSPYILAD